MLRAPETNWTIPSDVLGVLEDSPEPASSWQGEARPVVLIDLLGWPCKKRIADAAGEKFHPAIVRPPSTCQELSAFPARRQRSTGRRPNISSPQRLLGLAPPHGLVRTKAARQPLGGTAARRWCSWWVSTSLRGVRRAA